MTVSTFTMHITLVTALAFFKVNLGNMVYILKFKLFGLDIWKDCTHLIFISLHY